MAELGIPSPRFALVRMASEPYSPPDTAESLLECIYKSLRNRPPLLLTQQSLTAGLAVQTNAENGMGVTPQIDDTVLINRGMNEVQGQGQGRVKIKGDGAVTRNLLDLPIDLLNWKRQEEGRNRGPRK